MELNASWSITLSCRDRFSKGQARGKLTDCEQNFLHSTVAVLCYFLCLAVSCKVELISRQRNHNSAGYKYGLLTKCEVKMAGYWPSPFFLRVYGPRRSRGP